jgi:hypothetical protein
MPELDHGLEGSQAAMRHPSSLNTFAARTGLNEGESLIAKVCAGNIFATCSKIFRSNRFFPLFQSLAFCPTTLHKRLIIVATGLRRIFVATHYFPIW